MLERRENGQQANDAVALTEEEHAHLAPEGVPLKHVGRELCAASLSETQHSDALHYDPAVRASARRVTGAQAAAPAAHSEGTAQSCQLQLAPGRRGRATIMH